MMSQDKPNANTILIKALTFTMFMMFAMTTDSVGVVIPEIIRQFSLGLTTAGSFQYATMSGISVAALSTSPSAWLRCRACCTFGPASFDFRVRGGNG